MTRDRSLRSLRSIGMTLRVGDAVSVVVYEGGAGGRVLAVKRPADEDEPFAGMWGLPAATVGEGETAEETVRRLGRQKLGMTLEVVREISRGTQPRGDGELSMVLFEARAEESEAKLVREWDAKGVTYYTKWRWAEADAFLPAAEAGSLCCQLYLDATTPRDATRER